MRHISNQDGFVLVVGLILMTVLATIALGSFAVSTTEVQVSSNYRSSVQAVTLAEGAVAQVIYWFKNPATFTDATVVTYHASTPVGAKGADFFTRRRTSSGGAKQFFRSGSPRFSQFYDVDGDGTGDTSSASPALEYKSSNAAQKTFLDTTFAVVSAAGNITNIKLFGSSNPEEVALVQVTAQSKGGGTATIEAVLGPNPGGGGVAGGLEVGGDSAFNGNAEGKLHWGKALIVRDANFGNPVNAYRPPQLTCDITNPGAHPNEETYGTGMPNRVDDPWLLIKVGGTVTLGGSGPYDWDDYAALVAAYPGHENILPGLNNDDAVNGTTNNVSISKISYDDAKVVARKSKFYKGSTAYDSYYYTKSGALEKDRIYDSAGTQYTLTNRIDGITKGTIFVDTTDQKIPNAAGSNLQELAIGGNILFKGTMLLAANLKTTGLLDVASPPVYSPPWNSTLVGGCPDYPSLPSYCWVGASRPMCSTAPADRKPVDLPRSLQGLVYVFGQLTVTGNLKIFGALITERGFVATGTSEFWFDYDLKVGSLSDPSVFIRSWREVGST